MFVLGFLAFVGCGESSPATGVDAELDQDQVADLLPDQVAVDLPVVPADPFVDPIVFDDDAIGAIDPSTLPQARSPCRPPVLVRVTRTSDGDTITVERPDGTREERVRTIGVDTPEIAHSPSETAECFGPEAQAFTRQLQNHVVWLTFDRLCIDPYDRTLAYVHISAAEHGFWERQVLRRGFAPAFIIGRNDMFEDLLNADEARAQADNRGLWAACPRR